MNTLIIATLIFLDTLPGSLPFVTNLQESLGDKIEVEERQVTDTSPEPLIFTPLPYQNDKFYELTVNADTYIAVDMETGEIMLEKDKDKAVMIASLTKLMTAKLLLKDGDLGKAVTVENLSKMHTDDSRMWLAVGDKATYKTLLHGLLINSAADSALVIADNLYPGGYNEFITKMNVEAQEMNLKNTHFDNPVGWDSPKNYSTAQDLQILTRTLLKNDIFKKIVGTKRETVYSQNGKPYNLQNTNLLLNNTTTFGVKTGTTPSAGQCLITLSKIEDQDVLYVLLGAQDRFYEAKNLFNWTALVYNW